MNTENVDVLISGGGPVGLYFAYRMARLGHTFYLCDKKDGPTTETRALGMTAKTIETLENHNIAKYILKEAITLRGVQIFRKGSKLAAVDAAGDTVFAQMTVIPQSGTETQLAALLGEDNIHRKTELIHYQQNEDGVDAIVRNMKDGSETKIHAKYIVGADGAHSAVRKLAKDWAYEGFSMATKFAVGDVWITGKDAHNIARYRGNAFVHPDGICGIIPAGEKDGRFYHRAFVNLGQYKLEASKETTHGLDQNESITIEEFQQIVNIRTSPLEVYIENVDDIAIFRINERKADGFRRNRAFVVGDAAHCHSPVGGQGLNLGIQDADNLSWKLSLVLSGHSSDPETVLDSYNIEREPIVAATIKRTGSATRLGLSGGWILSLFLTYLMPVILSFDRIKNTFASAVMQLNTKIPKESYLISHVTHNANRLIEPGQSIRDTTALRKRIITTDDRVLVRQTLHQILQTDGVQHAVMLVCSRYSRIDPCLWTKDFWNKFANQGYPTTSVRPIIVESSWHALQNKAPEYITATSSVEKVAEEAFWLEENWDVDTSISNRVGLVKHMSNKLESPAALVVVRPDLYVAYSDLIRSADDIDRVFEFLNGYLRANVID